MKVMRFNKPALYLRRDPDMGWHMAIWKWRIAFQVTVGVPSSDGGQAK